MTVPADLTPLPAREAYRLWADSYDAENPVTILERDCVRDLMPLLRGKALLDAACGTGRRLPDAETGGARRVVAVDLVHEMIHRAQARRRTPRALAVADVRALPFLESLFDIVWFRLAAGHVPDLGDAYRELARAARAGAYVIVTDFHPAAASAGHVRSFRDARGTLRVVEHHIHDVGVHVNAATRAGLTLERTIEPAVGPTVRQFYVAAGRLAAYERQRGLPLVLALLFRA
ncbi:MAG: methyltransferase domain-containing protein [Gemmatimonas sp.]|nr:methyltransferase domain-containing protein [Gemmatimonas sp.]